MNRNQTNSAVLLALFVTCIFALTSCSESQLSTSITTNTTKKRDAIHTLNRTIGLAAGAKVSTSTDIDWSVGVLPWDRFTLPVFSPDGIHTAVQLGTPPSFAILAGTNNNPVESTTIELHVLDPVQGRQTSPLIIDQQGLILSRAANDSVIFVESPKGALGRWIGQIDWETGVVEWLVDDDEINTFPTTNLRNDLAWSRRAQDENRFHLVVRTNQHQRTIDDGTSDWVFPSFLGNDRLRVFCINNGQLSLVELDLNARDPLLTAMSLTLLESRGSRVTAWQIATTNPVTTGEINHAFYHPLRKRMAVWQPDNRVKISYLAAKSVAAAPVTDGSWLVTTNKRVLRQSIDEKDGIHLRNQMAIPIATTSKQWTHLMLVPEGNRLRVHAVNLDR